MKKYLLPTSSFLLLLTSMAVANVQITNLQDYQFGEIDLHNINAVNHPLCIYNSDSTSNSYLVQIYSNAAGGKYVMTNGISQLPYSIKWSPVAAGGAGYQALSPNIPLHMDNASNELNCGGRDDANMEISVNPTELSGVTAGSYSTTLNIVISPV